MLICEAFGLYILSVFWILFFGEEILVYFVFFNVFIFFLKFWRFNYFFIEYGVGDVFIVGF